MLCLLYSSRCFPIKQPPFLLIVNCPNLRTPQNSSQLVVTTPFLIIYSERSLGQCCRLLDWPFVLFRKHECVFFLHNVYKSKSYLWLIAVKTINHYSLQNNACNLNGLIKLSHLQNIYKIHTFSLVATWLEQKYTTISKSSWTIVTKQNELR